MFVNEITSKPAYVEGRKFLERTINSKFKKADISITTTYMDGKPILKHYIFEGENCIKDIRKTIRKGKVKDLYKLNRVV